MPLLRSILFTALFITGSVLFNDTHAQMTRAEQRAMRERGTDSAWIFNPFGGNTRFFLGATRVSPFEFENSLRDSDPEVEALIDGAYNKFRVGRIFSYTGGAAALAGIIWLYSSNTWDGRNQNTTGPLVLMSAALVLEGISVGFSIDANNRYRRGMRVFNKKAREGTLQNVQVNVGFTGNGLGVGLRF
jgi:hypothetical protein